MKRPKLDVPGDSIASARAVAQFWYDVGVAVGDIDRYRSTNHHDAPTLTALKLKCDPADEQGVLVMASGYTEDRDVVAFHRGENVVEAITGMSRRLKNHTAKWKDDAYGRGGKGSD